jgi:hypothetical protein
MLAMRKYAYRHPNLFGHIAALLFADFAWVIASLMVYAVYPENKYDDSIIFEVPRLPLYLAMGIIEIEPVALLVAPPCIYTIKKLRIRSPFIYATSGVIVGFAGLLLYCILLPMINFPYAEVLSERIDQSFSDNLHDVRIVSKTFVAGGVGGFTRWFCRYKYIHDIAT